jgi:hypothetical protein
MKPSVLATVVLAVAQGLLHAASGSRLPQLAYAFPEGETNAYRVEVEFLSENRRDVISGHVLVSARRIENDVTVLLFRGQIGPTSRIISDISSASSTASKLRSIFLSRSPTPGSGAELFIDARGQVLRETGEAHLPIPLGGLLRSFIEPLPEGRATRWTGKERVVIVDEPVFRGPANHMQVTVSSLAPDPSLPPYPRPQAVLAAEVSTSGRLTALPGNLLRLEKAQQLATPLRTGAEPRVRATNDVVVILDRATGIPREITHRGEMTALTTNVSRHNRISLHWKLLEGMDRAAVMAPPTTPDRPAEPKRLSESELTELIAQARLGNASAQSAALARLATARFDKVPDEVLNVMGEVAAQGEASARRQAMRFLASHATDKHAELLIAALRDPDSFVRHSAAQGVGRIRNPKAIPGLVDWIAAGDAESSYRPTPSLTGAGHALVGIGAQAEDAVLGLFRERNIKTRVQACLILQQIGTRKSMETLQEMVLHPDKELGSAAGDALRAIQARLTD